VDFIAGIIASATAWPLTSHGQPVLGRRLSVQPWTKYRGNLVDAFRHGLMEAGYAEGRNMTIEYRFAENQIDRLPALAADLVSRNVAVIVATGGGNSALAAKAATSTIPIVFVTAGDPVQLGFVAGLNQPGVNTTGVSWFGSQLAGKGLVYCTSCFPRLPSSRY
jgi:putative ABC transport system substrate-binding protein